MTALAQYARLEAPGRYFDGESAAPRSVMLSFGARSLVVMGYDGVAIDHWPLGSLTAVSPPGQTPLQIAPDPESDLRIVLDEPAMIDALRAVCPRLHARPLGRRGLGKGLLFGGLALAAVALMVTTLIPALAGQLALMIPPERERRLGDAVVEQLQDLLALGGGAEPVLCTAASGQAALEVMMARLDAGAALPYPVRVGVIDHPLVNAVAVPGGRILLFRGLIEHAESAEEVAGVLAHELGHVVHRDPTVEALRAAGSAGILGLLVGDVVGAGIVVAASEAVLNASYRREAEARADDTAIRLLAEAGLPSGPFADFFRRMRARYGEVRGVFRYFASHPALEARAERAEAGDAVAGGDYEPVLGPAEWRALRGICSATPAPGGG